MSRTSVLKGQSGIQRQEGEIDLPPEQTHYRDDGCNLYPACLSCPFPHCIYDAAGGRRTLARELRDQEIVRQARAGGITVAQLAERFRINKRTVQRALSHPQKPPRGVVSP